MATNRVVSTEDGDLTTSIITTRSKNYRDIDLSFAAKPNGEIYIKKDAAAVKQAIKNLILTNHFEKPFEPFFGGDLTALLFELAYDDVAEDAKSQIIEAITRFEPRAEIRDIQVNSDPDRNSIDVSIEFKVVNSDEVVRFTTTVLRLR